MGLPFPFKRPAGGSSFIGLPRWHSSDESACNAGNTGLIPGLGQCLGEGNGNPLQYSCLGNPIEKPGRIQSMELEKMDSTGHAQSFIACGLSSGA